MSQRALGPFDGIDVATPHSGLQGFGSQVDENDLGYSLHHPVGYGLAHLDASDIADHRYEALDVLNVHGREHIDARVQQFHDVFVTLDVPGAFDVGVSEFIYE